jgi:hypothetical protein
MYIRNMKRLFILGAFLTPLKIYSQLSEGQYTYSNNDLSLSLTISDGGWAISKATITRNLTGKTITGAGEWFKVNMNGADEDYKGPEGWYQFENSECFYEFNEPSNELKLTEGCGQNEQKTYLLKLKQ